MAYIPIPRNPYIVGNPIQSASMFYGRNEDFLYIRDKLSQETKGLIVTLAGERRSGKTSILFQIMNGRLGEEFVPFFIDMQAMAAVESDAQFLARMDQAMRPQIDPAIPIRDYQSQHWQQFESLIADIKASKPGCKLIFLLDEYELIENKIEKHLISEELITFLANLMENHGVYFLFTGSNKLEERTTNYWKVLFSKSQYRKITFLKHNDCLDLISKPLEGYVNYSEEQLDKIWRLAAGQPFYTQIFCQNMVDRLQIEKRNDVLEEDIDAVISDIVDNPMPQMIYFWQELEPSHKLAMSLLAEVLQRKEDWADSHRLIQAVKDHKLDLDIAAKDLHTAMEELYHRDILSKKGNDYQFRVDIFRFWVKQEQNIWKLLREIKIEKPASKGSGKLKLALAAAVIVIIAGAGFFWQSTREQAEFGSSKDKTATRLYKEGSRYLEDGNYTLALKNADAALKADSLFFKAAMLRAETLKAMNRPDRALEAYGTAEGLYGVLTSRLGKEYQLWPDSTKAVASGSAWFIRDGLLCYDGYSTRIAMDIQLMRPTQHQDTELLLAHPGKKKVLKIPHAQYLDSKKHIAWCYDTRTQQVSAWNVIKGKKIWSYQTAKNEPGDRYFVGARSLTQKAGKLLVFYNRCGLYVLDPKSGKELAKRLYPKGELRMVSYRDKSRHLLVFTEKDALVLRDTDLKKIGNPLPKWNNAGFWITLGDFIVAVSFSPSNQLIYSYDASALRLNQGFSLDESLNITMRASELVFTRSDSLFIYSAKTNTLKHIALPGGAIIQSFTGASNFNIQMDHFCALSEKDLYVIDTQGRIKHTIPLTALGEEGNPAQPQMLDIDQGRNRLVYTYTSKGEESDEGQSLAVFDLKTQAQLFNIRIGGSYNAIFATRRLYTLVRVTQDYDGRNQIVKYSGLLMDPKSYRIMPLEDLGLLQSEKATVNLVRGNKLYTLRKYPPSEERSLQSIHENMVLLQEASGKQDEVFTTFRRMLPYLRRINNLNWSQTVARAVIAKAPLDLGFYASKLRDTDSNFGSIQATLEQAMNIRPNRSISTLKLNDREFWDNHGDELITFQYDPSYTTVQYFKLEGGKRVPLFKASRNVPAVSVGDWMHVYHKQGEQARLHICEPGKPLRSQDLPFQATTRSVVNWLDENTLYYITQQQAKQGFDYTLGSLALNGAAPQVLKSWSSPLSLNGSLAYQGKIGIVMTDSLAVVRYIPTAESKVAIPPLARIITANGNPVSSSQALDPSQSPGARITYSYKGSTATVDLDQMQLYTSLFADLAECKVFWLDPASKSMSEAQPFGYINPGIADLTAYSDSFTWEGRYLKLTISGVKYSAQQLIDVLTGNVTWIRGEADNLGINNQIDMHWQIPNRLWVWNGPQDTNQIAFEQLELSQNGTMRSGWQSTLPWRNAYIMNETPTHLIAWSDRKVDEADFSEALLYLNKQSGQPERQVTCFNGNTIIIFHHRAPLIYDKKLGFYDPVAL